MHRAMINCNQVQTEVISEGRWIEEDPTPNSNKDVTLVLTGNPGIPGFYEVFIKVLNKRLTSKMPVWVVGHAGHVQPPKNLDIAMPGDDKWAECYGLTAQLQHKAEFIKRYVPEDAQLHLIGHSIGAWMALNLLKDHDIAKRIKKCYLLFPTIERMAESRNGKNYKRSVLTFASLWIFLCWIFTTIFPLFLQVTVIRLYCRFYGYPTTPVRAFQDLLHPRVLHNIIKLASEEVKYVREIDHDTISKNIDKLWFYYGATDGWVPLKYYKDIISKHPELNAEVGPRGIRHAFVLYNSIEMGHIVGDVINENSRH